MPVLCGALPHGDGCIWRGDKYRERAVRPLSDYVTGSGMHTDPAPGDPGWDALMGLDGKPVAPVRPTSREVGGAVFRSATPPVNANVSPRVRGSRWCRAPRCDPLCSFGLWR